MPGMAGGPVQPLWAREAWSRLRSISGSSTGAPPRGVFITALSQLLPAGGGGGQEDAVGDGHGLFIHSFTCSCVH